LATLHGFTSNGTIVTTATFDYSALLRPDLPPAAVKWTGFPSHNFIGGHNDADSVPVDDLIEAAARVLKREGRTLATYGLNSGSLGYLPLREFLARKLACDAGIACSPDEILITSGSLQGLDLVNAALLSPGDTVILEDMTYGGTITRLKRAGVNMVGVPVDHDGMRTDAVEAALRDLAARGIRPKFIYTIPTVQNPTATVLSEPRRRELLALSARYGVPVFEDDCYADLTWDGRRPPALRAMSNDDRVIHIGSFSKTVAPALRIGFLVAGWPLMSRILGIKGDGGSGALEQMVLAEYCPEHFWPHVQALRARLKRKAEALMDALRAQFGGEAQFQYPAGGIFLWVGFPERVDTTRLTQAALQAGIAVNPGAEWTTDAQAGKSRIRMCFAHPSEQEIREGVAQLAQVCRREFGVPAAGMHR
jgi:2-aminoadipate transaminase